MKIFIDPGHNYSGSDTGATGNGLKEQDISFQISKKLNDILVNAGYETKMSRNNITDNVGGGGLSASISGRLEMANNWGADLFVSIHCNAYNGTARGTETLVYNLNGESTNIAKRIQESIVRELGTTDRGIKARADLGVLRKTNMPALLIETAFIDNAQDAALLKNRQTEFAQAIYKGITNQKIEKKEETNVALTVMKLPDEVYIQEIAPNDFSIKIVDTNKKNISEPNYFNLGYFAVEKGGITIPVGNLIINGEVIAQAKDNASWLNLAGHELTTIYTTKDGKCGITKTKDFTDDLSLYRQYNMAISGIPIIVNGKYIDMNTIKSEGYFGNELYDTWHGFLGIRHDKLVYVAMKCNYDEMCWALVALGIYNAIKVDGGGSFILKNGKILETTSENRRIHNIGCWTK